MPVPFLACMLVTAKLYHLPQRVLPSIQAVEGGAIGVAHPNANGSADLGVMQVNTIWIAPLAQIVGQSATTIRHRLLDDACFNILAAGAVLRTYLDNEKGDLLRAVGDYHSHTRALNLDYQHKIISAARALTVH